MKRKATSFFLKKISQPRRLAGEADVEAESKSLQARFGSSQNSSPSSTRAESLRSRIQQEIAGNPKRSSVPSVPPTPSLQGSLPLLSSEETPSPNEVLKNTYASTAIGSRFFDTEEEAAETEETYPTKNVSVKL